MTFFKHLENSIERITEKQRDAVQRRYESDLENDKLGLVPDDEKLRLLKQDLYRVARGKGDVSGLCRAIATLETSIEAKHKRDNNFVGTFNQIFNTAVTLACIAILFSFTAHGLCGNSRMPVCTNSTQLSRYLLNQFSEPK